ncbi:MAG: ABC transporter permease subunit [Clostridia bacterium]|nr:ABC transporter permease subunit [Clostridia bacterium]
MSKFNKLCSCEFKKIIKKKSTKVMFIILILSLFASAGIANLTKKMYSVAEEMTSPSNYKEDIQSMIDSLKFELNEGKDSLDEATKNEKQAQIDTKQFAIDNDVNIYNEFWKSEVIESDLYSSKLNIYNYKSLKAAEEEQKEQEKYDKIAELVKNDDFSGYIKYQKEELKKSLDANTIEQNEYDDELYILGLMEKYEIGKVYNPDEKWKSTTVKEIKTLKQNLRLGIDQISQKSLTEKTLEETKNNIIINEYRLEHNMEPYVSGMGDSVGSTRKVYDYMVGSISMMVLTVMMIIIAGGSISSEISKGTIKFWSFTPNKRWKILLSKLTVTTIFLIITTVILSLVGTLVGNIFFGASNAQDYIYASGGNVHTTNYIVFSILYNLTIAIDIFVFVVFAMMLSTVARNTAVSVGVSIAAYLGGSTIMQIVNMFVTADWIKFIPFNNLGLNERIFTSDMSYTSASMVKTMTGNIPVSFSLILLGVCVLIMLVTMFDSFRKRDIV